MVYGRFILSCGLLAATAGLSGCSRSAATAEPAEEAILVPEREMAWEEHSLGGLAAMPARPVPVKEGPAPLVYLTEQGVTVRIVDQTGGAQRTLAEMAVPGRTIVRVDNRNGVIAGTLTLVQGPLPAGRRYAILVVPQGESVSRTGTMRDVVAQPVEDEVTDRVVDPTGRGVITDEEPQR